MPIVQVGPLWQPRRLRPHEGTQRAPRACLEAQRGRALTRDEWQQLAKDFVAGLSQALKEDEAVKP